jgi:hypothetical protein
MEKLKIEKKSDITVNVDKSNQILALVTILAGTKILNLTIREQYAGSDPEKDFASIYKPTITGCTDENGHIFDWKLMKETGRVLGMEVDFDPLLTEVGEVIEDFKLEKKAKEDREFLFRLKNHSLNTVIKDLLEGAGYTVEVPDLEVLASRKYTDFTIRAKKGDIDIGVWHEVNKGFVIGGDQKTWTKNITKIVEKVNTQLVRAEIKQKREQNQKDESDKRLKEVRDFVATLGDTTLYVVAGTLGSGGPYEIRRKTGKESWEYQRVFTLSFFYHTDKYVLGLTSIPPIAITDNNKAFDIMKMFTI